MPALNRTLIRRATIVIPATEGTWKKWSLKDQNRGAVYPDGAFNLPRSLSSFARWQITLAGKSDDGTNFLPFVNNEPAGYVQRDDNQLHFRLTQESDGTVFPFLLRASSPGRTRWRWTNPTASSFQIDTFGGGFSEPGGGSFTVLSSRYSIIEIQMVAPEPERREVRDTFISCELRETESVLVSVQEPDPDSEEEGATREVEVIDTRERWLMRTGTVTHFEQLLDPDQADRVKTIVGIQQGKQFDLVESRYLVRATAATPIHPPVTPTPPVVPAEPTESELGTYAIVSTAAIPWGTVYAVAGTATLTAAAALPSGFARTVSTPGAVLTGPAVTPAGVTGIRFQVHVGQREAANLVVPYAPMFGRGFVFLGNDAQGNAQWLSYRVSGWSAGGGLAFFPYGENTTVPAGTSLRVSLVYG